MYTVDWDEDLMKWVITKRDGDNMPLDQFGEYDSEKAAKRAMAQRKYGDKTRRPVVWK